jgi:hypothetical protein
LEGLDGAFEILDCVPEMAVLVVNETDEVEPHPFIECFMKRTDPELFQGSRLRVPVELEIRTEQSAFCQRKGVMLEAIQEFAFVRSQELESLQKIDVAFLILTHETAIGSHILVHQCFWHGT